jgi:ComF family protein
VGKVWEARVGTVNLNTSSPSQSIVTRLGAWLLPPRCVVCAQPGHAGRDLCAACHADLRPNEPCCARCALPLAVTAPVCGACLRREPPYASARAALRYAAPVDQLLARFKFHAGLAEGRVLAALLLDAVAREAFGEVDAIVPLPLHRARLARRGYNQALELARPLARAWKLPLCPDALRRVRVTQAQTELDAAERRRNVRGAFAATDAAVRGRRLLLLDDVVTTGATVHEAAATLRAAGAARVDVLALARAAAPGQR